MAAGFTEPAVTDAYTSVYNCKNLSSWIIFYVTFFGYIFIYIPVVVCCYNNEIKYAAGHTVPAVTDAIA